VFREVAPAGEAVSAGNEVLRFGKRERAVRRPLADLLLDSFHDPIETFLDERGDGLAPQAGECVEPFRRPRANRVGLGRAGCLHQILRPLPVLRQIRTRRKRQGVHTKLLSVLAWCPLGSG
jgi:hypothetical protein